jgi:hypothetical protein
MYTADEAIMSNARFISEPMPAAERERVSRGLAAFSRTMDWFDAHYDELVAQHPGRWVAFDADGVLATGASQEEVLAQADRRLIERGEASTEFVPAEPMNLIL